jgi:hypothetical protein
MEAQQKTDWHYIDEAKPEDESRPILVYWEDGDDCYLESEYGFSDGALVNSDYEPVCFPENATPIWSYWPIF